LINSTRTLLSNSSPLSERIHLTFLPVMVSNFTICSFRARLAAVGSVSQIPEIRLCPWADTYLRESWTWTPRQPKMTPYLGQATAPPQIQTLGLFGCPSHLSPGGRYQPSGERATFHHSLNGPYCPLRQCLHPPDGQHWPLGGCCTLPMANIGHWEGVAPS
jgi:hypothetical protein